jgi:flagellin
MKAGSLAFEGGRPVSININSTSPILAALQDLNGSGQSNGDSGVIGGQSSSGTSNAASSAAVTLGQNGSLDLSAMDADAMSLNRTTSIADLAVGAGQSVTSLLTQLKDQATAAQNPSLDGTTRQALDGDFKSTLSQIASTVAGASFDGVNLIDGQSTAGLTASAGGASLSAQNLTLGGPVVTLAATSSLGTPTAATSALADITNSLTNIEAALGALSDQANQVSAHSSILNQLTGVLQVGTAANTDSGADGARLMALQVQQQLSGQTQPIANQSPQLVLSLFR